LGAVALSCILGVFATPGWGLRSISVEEALLRVKPAVVLVVVELAMQARVDCGDGEMRVSAPPLRTVGSGWIVDAGGFVVTNAHVLQPVHSPDDGILTALTRDAVAAGCLPKALAREGVPEGARPDLEAELKRKILSTIAPRARALRVRPAIHVLFSDGTRHDAEIAKYSSERGLALLKINASDPPVFPVGTAGKTIGIGERVHLFGFPAVVSIDELLRRAVTVRAAVTPGRVSGFEKDAAENPVIRIDVATSHASGGPAVDDSGALVGILTRATPEGQPATARGVDFIIPGETLRDFLKDRNVASNARSRFTNLWWSALSAFFSGEYGAATRRLERAATLRPDEPDVRRLLTEARTRRPGRSWPWIAAGAGVLGAFAIIRWVHRSRQRPVTISVSEAASLLESPTPPLFLDARAESVYLRSPVRVATAIRVTPGGPIARHPYTSRLVVAYGTCPDAGAAVRLARQLRHGGYRNLRILEGGLDAWVAAGLPLEPNDPADLGVRRASG
jgi:S1-C subfamily serine protease/rhodanese-related sulfurtransferase